MDFFCSFCGKRKGDAKDWLLGFESTKEKSVVMKYAITLLGKWDVRSRPAADCGGYLADNSVADRGGIGGGRSPRHRGLPAGNRRIFDARDSANHFACQGN